MHRLIIDGETVITGSFNKLMGQPRGILIPTEEPEKLGCMMIQLPCGKAFGKPCFVLKLHHFLKGLSTGNNS